MSLTTVSNETNPLTYLSRKNAHPRDVNIRFQEEGHIYWITGMDGHPVSTTTLIHKFFEPFIPDEVVNKMLKSKNVNNPNWEYYGMTAEEIKQQWIDASKLGTDMHQAIEDYINLEACPKEPKKRIIVPTLDEIESRSNSSSSTDEEKIMVPKLRTEWNVPRLPPLASQTKEFGFFLKFWKDLKAKYPGLKPYRTEWLVYDEIKRVSGSIDLTMIQPNGKLRLYDWKRSKGISKEGFKGKKGKGPFSNLPDCNFITYSIQLNIYRRYLENKYGKEIESMSLVVLHPNNDDYILIEVDFMNEEIDALWDMLPLSPEDCIEH